MIAACWLNRIIVNRLRLATLFLVWMGCLSGCQQSTDPEEKTDMPHSPQNPGPDQLSEEELSRRWRDESKQYVSAINDFVRRGLKEGWENIDDEEPKDTRQPMAEAVIEAVRRANQAGDIDDLHERFPRAHSPFWEMLEKNGQDLPVAVLLNDGRIIMRIGAPYESGQVVVGSFPQKSSRWGDPPIGNSSPSLEIQE